MKIIKNYVCENAFICQHDELFMRICFKDFSSCEILNKEITMKGGVCVFLSMTCEDVPQYP